MNTLWDDINAWVERQTAEAERRIAELGDKFEGRSIPEIVVAAGDLMSEWDPSDETLEATGMDFIVDWKYGDWNPGAWLEPRPGSLIKEMSYVPAAVEWNVYNLYLFAESRGRVPLNPLKHYATTAAELKEVVE